MPMALDERRAASLDRTWDAVIRGEPMPVPDPADAVLASLVVRLQATSAVPALFPDPASSWRHLRARETRAPKAGPLTPPITGAHGRDAGRLEQQITPLRPQSTRRWWTSQFWTAALLLVAAAAALLMLSQGALREQKTETWLPDAEMTSIPGYAEDVLFQATFAADELPHRPAAAVFYRVTLPPGARLPYLAATNCLRSSCNTDAVNAGVGIELVEAGAYGIYLNGPIWVQRAGASARNREIPAGQVAVLRPGEAAIFHDYTATGEIHNPGTEPVEILGMAIVDYGSGGEPIANLPADIGAEQLDISLTTDWGALPDGPVTVSLRRVTLPPQTLLPPFEPRGLESIRVESGSIAWMFAHSAESAEGGPRIHRRPGETAPFAISPGGAMRFLESTGAEPAELLVLTIEPAGLDGNPLMP